MKHCNFDARFRKSTALVANEMGLEFTSTPRQVENGTLMFYDPQAKVSYSMHESGYVRRYIMGGWPFGGTRRMYQLNKTKSYLVESGWYRKERILASPDEQLAIMVRAVVNHRLNNI
jgi:hypothetical protein